MADLRTDGRDMTTSFPSGYTLPISLLSKTKK